MEERLLRNALLSLTFALEETSEDTTRLIKSRLKKDLELYLAEKEKALEKAKRYEEQCLQSDDGFSRATEEAMADTETVRWSVDISRDLLKLFPPDKRYKIRTMSGEQWVTES